MEEEFEALTTNCTTSFMLMVPWTDTRLVGYFVASPSDPVLTTMKLSVP
jgi:hypothetical protein